MKRSRHKLLTIIFSVFALLFVYSPNILAQCAMCKASVETNVNEDGVGFAASLNTGILYLFVMPYLLAVIIAYFWYKKSKEHKKQLEEAALRKQKIAKL